jgi:hypothetical protein
MEDISSIDGVFDGFSAALAASSNFCIAASGEARVLLASQEVVVLEENVLLFIMKGSKIVDVDIPDKIPVVLNLVLGTMLL